MTKKEATTSTAVQSLARTGLSYKAYHCPSCDKEIKLDVNIKELYCPLCNTKLKPGADMAEELIDRVLAKQEPLGEIYSKTGGSISNKYELGGDREVIRTKCWNCDGWVAGEPKVEPMGPSRCPHCDKQMFITYVKVPTGWYPANLNPDKPLDPQIDKLLK